MAGAGETLGGGVRGGGWVATLHLVPAGLGGCVPQGGVYSQ